MQCKKKKSIERHTMFSWQKITSSLDSMKTDQKYLHQKDMAK